MRKLSKLKFFDSSFTGRAYSVKAGRVKVRIWKPGSTSVGHASLETSKHYISLWPKSSANKPAIKWFSYEGELIDNVKKDILANSQVTAVGIVRKKPDVVATLKMLNESTINNAFEKIKRNELKWALIGNNKVFLKQDVHSCVSLVSYLLKQGGIDHLLIQAAKMGKSSSYTINKLMHDIVIVTPRNLEIIVTAAVEVENTFKKQNKTALNRSSPAKKRSSDNSIEEQPNNDLANTNFGRN